MIGLGLDPCQEQPFTRLSDAPVVWMPKRSANLAVCSRPASRLPPFAPRMDRCMA